jgi:hypothetical protein
LHQLAPTPEALLDEALRHARLISPDCASAYAASKRALQLPTMNLIDGAAAEMDRVALRAVMAPSSQRAQAMAVAHLKKQSS